MRGRSQPSPAYIKSWRIAHFAKRRLDHDILVHVAFSALQNANILSAIVMKRHFASNYGVLLWMLLAWQRTCPG
jgi:hypothetical protein